MNIVINGNLIPVPGFVQQPALDVSSTPVEISGTGTSGMKQLLVSSDGEPMAHYSVLKETTSADPKIIILNNNDLGQNLVLTWGSGELIKISYPTPVQLFILVIN